MAATVLVPIDGSPSSHAAFEYALQTFPDADLTLFHAIDPFDENAEAAADTPLTQAWLDERNDAVEDLFETALQSVEADPSSVETDVAVGSPAQTILGYVEDNPIDQVVIGSRGRGRTQDLRLGSVSEVVVRRASVPVTVVR